MSVGAPRRSAYALRAIARGALMSVCALLPSLSAAEITSARYTDPTTRYPHGVLGDQIEHATLQVTLQDGRTARVTWPDTVVFEDTNPRVVDLNNDGDPEVIVVESHEAQGARLAIYGMVDRELALRAATPFIGTRFRWLAVVGAADLDGDGVTEIAYVDRPHLAKTLRVWRYEDHGDTTATLSQVAQLPGVSNHRIGEADIAGGIRTCAEIPEMVVATANWTRVLGVAWDGAEFTTTDLGPHQGRGSFANAMGC